MRIDGYYICDYETQTPISGPYGSPQVAAKIISMAKFPERFCTMSRYQLAKDGHFPKNKTGDREILTLLSIAIDHAWKATETQQLSF